VALCGLVGVHIGQLAFDDDIHFLELPCTFLRTVVANLASS
jgi:hypothetical protein